MTQAKSLTKVSYVHVQLFSCVTNYFLLKSLISQTSQNAVYHKRTAETETKALLLSKNLLTLPLCLKFPLSKEQPVTCTSNTLLNIYY